MTVTAAPQLSIEIWSDVVCPWCYIGKRRFEAALAELDGEIDIEVSYRAYQLDPTASPGSTMPVREAYARKFGGFERAAAMMAQITETAETDGLKFRLDRALRANTLLAHRVLWWAEQPESPSTQEALKERLLHAYFIDGLDIGDPDTLAGLAAEVGFDRAAVITFLESDAGIAEVAAQIEMAGELGISAVPTFVINGQWAIPGAQEADTFIAVLRRAAARASGAAAN